MNIIDITRKQNIYHSPVSTARFFPKYFPTLYGYSILGKEILQCVSSIASCNDEEALPIILEHTQSIVYGFEKLGAVFSVEGMEYVRERPAIIIANHMSSLETIITTLFAGGKFPVSFVSKRSVMSYPFFKKIFAKLRPLLIDRVNPREDFKIVLSQGKGIVDQGRNLVIFAQGTRLYNCYPEDFSSIGVKLAKNTGCPIIPLAIKTNAWSVGKYIKDIGYMRGVPVKYKFFKPIDIISSTGKEEHTECVTKICETVNEWIKEDSL